MPAPVVRNDGLHCLLGALRKKGEEKRNLCEKKLYLRRLDGESGAKCFPTTEPRLAFCRRESDAFSQLVPCTW